MSEATPRKPPCLASSTPTHPATRCSLCDDHALAVFHLPGGCVAYPHLLVQALCGTHICKARPLAGMFLIADLTDGSVPLPGDWREE